MDGTTTTATIQAVKVVISKTTTTWATVTPIQTTQLQVDRVVQVAAAVDQAVAVDQVVVAVQAVVVVQAVVAVLAVVAAVDDEVVAAVEADEIRLNLRLRS